MNIIQLNKYFAEPLALPHGTLVYQGTPVGNHWSKGWKTPIKKKKEKSDKICQIIYKWHNNWSQTIQHQI